MKTKRSLLLTLALTAAPCIPLHAAPPLGTGSFGWGFDCATGGTFMTAYSDTGGYQENVYPGGGSIVGNTWQLISYSLNKTTGELTTTVEGSAPVTAPGGPTGAPADFFFAFGSGVHGGLVPFIAGPIYIRDIKMTFDNEVIINEQFADDNVGDNLLDGTHAYDAPDGLHCPWSDFTGTSVPMKVAIAPGGFKAAAITDANGFANPWTIPVMLIPNLSGDQRYIDATTINFSILVYWPLVPVRTDDFKITDFQYNPTTEQISLTWESIPGRDYTISFTGDPIDFSPQLPSTVHANSYWTTHTFSNPILGSPKVFLRVTRNP